MDHKKRALVDLLLDAKIFADVLRLMPKVNIFKILKLEQHEIRHSNILAWLFDPSGSHSIKDNFTKVFFDYVYQNHNLEVDSNEFNFQAFINESMNNLLVFRETHHLDLLLVDNTNKRVVTIENKVHATAGKSQLQDYEAVISNKYPHYEKLFIYLKPVISEEIPASWVGVSYEAVLVALNAVLQQYLDENVRLILQNYEDLVRRVIMNDDFEIKELVRSIYEKHKTALDLIIEYKPDFQMDIYHTLLDYIEELIKEEAFSFITFNRESSSKQLIRVSTKKIEELLKRNTKTNTTWCEGALCAFEFMNYKGEFKLQFVIAPTSEHLDDKNKLYQIDYPRFNKRKTRKASTIAPHTWYIPSVKHLVLYDEDNLSTDILEEIKVAVRRAMLNEIKEIEKLIIKAFS